MPEIDFTGMGTPVAPVPRLRGLRKDPLDIEKVRGSLFAPEPVEDPVTETPPPATRPRIVGLSKPIATAPPPIPVAAPTRTVPAPIPVANPAPQPRVALDSEGAPDIAPIDFTGMGTPIKADAPAVPKPTATGDVDETTELRRRFVPHDAANWSINNFDQIGSAYFKQFNQAIPTRAYGQGHVHNSSGWDHRNAVDIGINPNTAQGKWLVDYLVAHRIPFQAFYHAAKTADGRTIATGPHIHVGMPSHHTDQQFAVGTKLGPAADRTNGPSVPSADTISFEGMGTPISGDPTPVPDAVPMLEGGQTAPNLSAPTAAPVPAASTVPRPRLRAVAASGAPVGALPHVQYWLGISPDELHRMSPHQQKEAARVALSLHSVDLDRTKNKQALQPRPTAEQQASYRANAGIRPSLSPIARVGQGPAPAGLTPDTADAAGDVRALLYGNPKEGLSGDQAYQLRQLGRAQRATHARGPSPRAVSTTSRADTISSADAQAMGIPQGPRAPQPLGRGVEYQPTTQDFADQRRRIRGQMTEAEQDEYDSVANKVDRFLTSLEGGSDSATGTVRRGVSSGVQSGVAGLNNSLANVLSGFGASGHFTDNPGMADYVRSLAVEGHRDASERTAGDMARHPLLSSVAQGAGSAVPTLVSYGLFKSAIASTFGEAAATPEAVMSTMSVVEHADAPVRDQVVNLLFSYGGGKVFGKVEPLGKVKSVGALGAYGGAESAVRSVLDDAMNGRTPDLRKAGTQAIPGAINMGALGLMGGKPEAEARPGERVTEAPRPVENLTPESAPRVPEVVQDLPPNLRENTEQKTPIAKTAPLPDRQVVREPVTEPRERPASVAHVQAVTEPAMSAVDNSDLATQLARVPKVISVGDAHSPTGTGQHGVMESLLGDKAESRRVLADIPAGSRVIGASGAYVDTEAPDGTIYRIGQGQRYRGREIPPTVKFYPDKFGFAVERNPPNSVRNAVDWSGATEPVQPKSAPPVAVTESPVSAPAREVAPTPAPQPVEAATPKDTAPVATPEPAPERVTPVEPAKIAEVTQRPVDEARAKAVPAEPSRDVTPWADRKPVETQFPYDEPTPEPAAKDRSGERGSVSTDLLVNFIPAAVRRVRNTLSVEPTPALTEADLGQEARVHASARNSVPHAVKDLLAQVFPDSYRKPEEMARTIDILNKDNIIGGYNEFLRRAEDARLNYEDAAAKKWQARADAIGTPEDLEYLHQQVLAAKDDPAIAANIARWNEHVNPYLDTLYNKMKGVDANTPREGRGLLFGARINLLPENRAAEMAAFADPGKPMPESATSNYRNPNAKRDIFDRAAKFTGEYSTNAQAVLTNVLGGRLNETTKLDFYNAIVDAGAGQLVGPDDAKPTEINGHKAVRLAVKVPETNAAGETRLVEKGLYVPANIAGEVRSVLNTDMRLHPTAISQALTQLQVFQLADLTAHLKNLHTVVASAPSSKSMMADIAKRFPGIGTARTVYNIANVVREVAADTPQIRAEVAEMAKNGLIRPKYPSTNKLTKVVGIGQEVIHHVDTAARIIMNRYFTKLVEADRMKDTPANRASFVQQIGEYNDRLMSPLMRAAKQSGLSPFIVAGRNFTRQGIRLLTGHPGAKAANATEAAKLRVANLANLTLAVTVPAIINYHTTGKFGGRPGTPVGAIDAGGPEDERGKHSTIDVLQILGIRRGLRATGMNALIEGVRAGQSRSEIEDQAGSDIITTATHPWVGPAAGFAFSAATGRRLDLRGGPQPQEARNMDGTGQSQLAENARVALKNQNPLLYALLSPKIGTEAENAEASYPMRVLGTAVKSPASAAGISAVDTPAMKLANQIKRAKGSYTVTPDKEAARVKAEDLITRANNGEDVIDEIQQAVDNGEVTDQQIKTLTANKKLSPLAVKVKYMNMADALRVWQRASLEEREKLQQTMQKKVNRAKPADLKAAEAVGFNKGLAAPEPLSEGGLQPIKPLGH